MATSILVSPLLSDIFVEICSHLCYNEIMLLYLTGDFACIRLLKSRLTRLRLGGWFRNVHTWPRLLLECPLTEISLVNTLEGQPASNCVHYRMMHPERVDMTLLPKSLSILRLHFANALACFSALSRQTTIAELFPHLKTLDFGNYQLCRLWRDEQEMMEHLPPQLETFILPVKGSHFASIVTSFPRTLTNLQCGALYYTSYEIESQYQPVWPPELRILASSVFVCATPPGRAAYDGTPADSTDRYLDTDASIPLLKSFYTGLPRTLTALTSVRCVDREVAPRTFAVLHDDNVGCLPRHLTHLCVDASPNSIQAVDLLPRQLKWLQIGPPRNLSEVAFLKALPPDLISLSVKMIITPDLVPHIPPSLTELKLATTDGFSREVPIPPCIRTLEVGQFDGDLDAVGYPDTLSKLTAIDAFPTPLALEELAKAGTLKAFTCRRATLAFLLGHLPSSLETLAVYRIGFPTTWAWPTRLTTLIIACYASFPPGLTIAFWNNLPATLTSLTIQAPNPISQTDTVTEEGHYPMDFPPDFSCLPRGLEHLHVTFVGCGKLPRLLGDQHLITLPPSLRTMMFVMMKSKFSVAGLAAIPKTLYHFYLWPFTNSFTKIYDAALPLLPYALQVAKMPDKDPFFVRDGWKDPPQRCSVM